MAQGGTVPSPVSGSTELLSDLAGRRILIVSYHFYPSNAIGARRMSELARFLIDRGAEVTVIAGPSRVGANLDSEVVGARLLRVASGGAPANNFMVRVKGAITRLGIRGSRDPSPGAGVDEAEPARPKNAATLEGVTGGQKETPISRLRRYWDSLLWLNDDKKIWMFRAIMRIPQISRVYPYDVVISSGPPMSGHWVGRFAAAKRNVPWIMDYRDPWGHDAVNFPQIQSPWKRWLESIQERYCTHRANYVVCTTGPIASQLRQACRLPADKVRVVLNGFDGEPAETPPPLGIMRLIYAGSIYLRRDPTPVIESIGSLIAAGDFNRHSVQFDLIGHVAEDARCAIDTLIAQLNLQEVVRILPAVSRHELAEFYRQANVLVNLAQQQEKQIPAKMYEYLQQCRDVLILTEAHSATAELVGDVSWCHIVEPGNAQSIRRVLLHLYNRLVVEGRLPDCDRTVVRRFSRREANEIFVRDICTLLGAA